MLKQPDCRVLVFNFNEREGSNYGSTFAVAGLIPIRYSKIEITDSVISVDTNKTKSSPSGNFAISLAPDRNWVADISVGSWIAIFIDSKKIPDTAISLWEYDSLKLIGRIDSVRATRQVNQQTGAWETSYSIVGRDWASALESYVYISPIAANSAKIASLAPGNASYGQVSRLVFDTKVRTLYDRDLPSSSDIADAFIDIWAKQGSAFNITSNLDKDKSEEFMPFSPFYVPPELVFSMGIVSTDPSKLSKIIETKYGILTGPGLYSRNEEAVGLFDLTLILGINSLWQVLNNTVTVGGINEIYADLSFKDNRPTMTLYKRVRPFSLKKSGLDINSLLGSVGVNLPLSSVNSSDYASQITSSFFNVPKTKIDTENIILVDVGGNWSDVVNFIEILPNTNLWKRKPIAEYALAGNMAIYSVQSYSISGFKPLRLSVSMFPKRGDGAPDIEGLSKWLDVLKEWYFDTHKMLNGSIVISGQSGYIPVGDNILFPAKAVANGDFVASSGVPVFSSGGSEQYILAHVETVSHSFKKQPNGEVNYTTTVQFVRGIITDENGSDKSASGTSGYGVDSKAPSQSRINSNTQVTK